MSESALFSFSSIKRREGSERETVHSAIMMEVWLPLSAITAHMYDNYGSVPPVVVSHTPSYSLTLSLSLPVREYLTLPISVCTCTCMSIAIHGMSSHLCAVATVGATHCITMLSRY